MPAPIRTKEIKKQHEGIATFLAFALIPLSGFATDIYLPSLPGMADKLQVTESQVQVTLSFFLISYGLGQLFIGSFLDSFGRFKISFYSLLIFAASCLGIAVVHDIYFIYAMRIVQGLTVSAVVVAKRAYFVDRFTGEKLKQYLSTFTIIWSTGPIIAPFIGAYFDNLFGWQSNFYFLAIFALMIAVAEYIFSGETLKKFSPFSINKIAAVYKSMLGTATFSLGIVLLGLAYSMVMVFNLTGPFIIQQHLHFSVVDAGNSSLILGIAWMIGGFLGKFSINKPFVRRMFINLFAQLIVVFIMLGSYGFVANLYSLVGFAFLVHVAGGFTFNNFFTYCLSRFPNNAGISSGITGGLTYVLVSFLSIGIIQLFPATDEKNLSYSYLILSVCSLVVMWLIYTIEKRGREKLLSKNE